MKARLYHLATAATTLALLVQVLDAQPVFRLRSYRLAGLSLRDNLLVKLHRGVNVTMAVRRPGPIK